MELELKNSNKLLGLEILRFISAVSVLIYHYIHFSYGNIQNNKFENYNPPFFPLLNFIYTYGGRGVEIFWCISGFIFFWKYKDSIPKGLISTKKFFVLRFSRLYPLHFVTLILVLILQLLYFHIRKYYFVYEINDLKHFILQLFMASNWGFENGRSFNGPIWSISVEILIYFIFFIIIKHFGAHKIINIALIIICVPLKLKYSESVIIDCLVFFYLGGFSALVYIDYKDWTYNYLLNRILLIFLIIFPLIILILKLYTKTYFGFLFIAGYTPILLYFLAQNFKINTFWSRTIEIAGNMTYASYLIHFPLQLLLCLLYSLFDKLVPISSPYLLILYVVFTLWLSYFTFKYFEMPAQTWIRKRFS